MKMLFLFNKQTKTLYNITKTRDMGNIQLYTKNLKEVTLYVETKFFRNSLKCK